MIRPNFDLLEKFSEEGDFDIVPVSISFKSKKKTLEIFSILKTKYECSFILDVKDEFENYGRYTFIGFDPKLKISCDNGNMEFGETQIFTTNPSKQLREILKKYRSPKLEYLPPFTGGFAGYFSYDYFKYVEPSINLSAKNDCEFKDLELFLFDKIVILDNLNDLITIIINTSLFEIDKNYKKTIEELNYLKKFISKETEVVLERGKLKNKFSSSLSKELYMEMVENSKKHIFEGDVFQIVLSNKFEAEFEGSLMGVYENLKLKNPSPYMFYISNAGIEIAGASPETLVKLESRVLHTYPLAGTRPRGKTLEEDMVLEKELLSDEKELAEHNMLVDLGRNDIGKISKFNSVEVDKYKTIERYSHVMHIGSSVKGTISDDKDAFDAIEAVLPAGTLSGAPKIKAVQLIDKLENDRRGIYGGALGYISFTGDMDMCIGIRLVYKKTGKIFVRSGAGIVADSVPENEYRECVNKAAAVIEAIRFLEEEII